MTDPIEAPDRDQLVAAATRIRDTAAVTDTDLRNLALSLLSIAEQAMPDTHLAEDSRCQLARAFLYVTLDWATTAYFEDTCGDCITGRCHWGGETSRRSTEQAKAGEDYEDPTYGRCGCARHTTSVLARAYRRDGLDATALAWQAAKDAGEIAPAEDQDADTIWVSRPVNHPTT